MATWSDGCFNGIRYAEGVAGGQGTRSWIANADTSITNQPNNKTIIVAIAMDTDDMCSLTDDLVLRWRNVTDAGSFVDLSGSGEFTWGGVSDLINGNAVVDAESMGEENCSTMGVVHEDGIEREGANLAAFVGIGSKVVVDCHWCVDLSGATAGKEYEFEIRDSTGGGGNQIAQPSASVSVVQAGKIDVVSRNADSSSTVGSVTVTAIESDEAGSDPKPLTAGGVRAQVVTNGSGVGTILGLVSGAKYFLHYYKDDTTDLADGTIEITAVDV